MRTRAFTLVDLLVVILIIGVLTALALPSYFTSVREGRHAVANANARTVALAIQSLYLKSGAKSYQDSAINSNAIARQLGGSVPLNPCTNGRNLFQDYHLQVSASTMEVEAEEGSLCFDASLPPIRFTGR